MSAFIDIQVAAVALLFVLASAGLAILTVWFWRNSALESPVLAPLEVMSDRRFRKASEEDRSRMLETVRSLAAERPIPIDPEPAVEELAEEDDNVEVAEPAPVVIDPLLGGRGN